MGVIKTDQRTIKNPAVTKAVQGRSGSCGSERDTIMPGSVFQTKSLLLVFIFIQNIRDCFTTGLPKGLTGIGPRGMVDPRDTENGQAKRKNKMDKQKGLNILGLAPSATLTDARTAFRRLAKTWHPDRFAKDPLKAKISEEKMKQVNEAFHFLLPLLPDTVVGQGVGQPSADSIHGCAPAYCSGKKSRGFFSSLTAGLKKCCHGRQGAKVRGTGSTGQTHKPGSHCQAGTAARSGKTEFETVFRNAVHHNQAGTKPLLRSKTRTPGRYADYRKYFDPVPGRPGNMGYMKNRGLGPVAEISPISPVSPVTRH